MNIRNVYLLLLITAMLFSSCASIFNSKRVSVNIISPFPAKLVVNGDSLPGKALERSVIVKRSRQPLEVELITDSAKNKIQVASINSGAYKANYFGIPYYGWE